MTIKPNEKQIHGTMQTECWQGERRFQLNEISFAEEIVVDDNALNFYVRFFLMRLRYLESP